MNKEQELTYYEKNKERQKIKSNENYQKNKEKINKKGDELRWKL